MNIRKQTAIWVTKSGYKIRICDMDDSHLANTIKMLERNARKKLSEEINAAYCVLAGLQGEMAQFYCEQDIDRMEETDSVNWLYEHMPIYQKLRDEFSRRTLQRTSGRE